MMVINDVILWDLTALTLVKKKRFDVQVRFDVTKKTVQCSTALNITQQL